MFVKNVICGKGILMKKIDIKGRSRVGVKKVPKCSLKIVLEERTPREFYKMMLKG
jgi:ribosomal protein L22